MILCVCVRARTCVSACVRARAWGFSRLLLLTLILFSCLLVFNLSRCERRATPSLFTEVKRRGARHSRRLSRMKIISIETLRICNCNPSNEHNLSLYGFGRPLRSTELLLSAPVFLYLLISRVCQSDSLSVCLSVCLLLPVRILLLCTSYCGGRRHCSDWRK